MGAIRGRIRNMGKRISQGGFWRYCVKDAWTKGGSSQEQSLAVLARSCLVFLQGQNFHCGNRSGAGEDRDGGGGRRGEHAGMGTLTCTHPL